MAPLDFDDYPEPRSEFDMTFTSTQADRRTFDRSSWNSSSNSPRPSGSPQDARPSFGDGHPILVNPRPRAEGRIPRAGRTRSAPRGNRFEDSPSWNSSRNSPRPIGSPQDARPSFGDGEIHGPIVHPPVLSENLLNGRLQAGSEDHISHAGRTYSAPDNFPIRPESFDRGTTQSQVQEEQLGEVQGPQDDREGAPPFLSGETEHQGQGFVGRFNKQLRRNRQYNIQRSAPMVFTLEERPDGGAPKRIHVQSFGPNTSSIGTGEGDLDRSSWISLHSESSAGSGNFSAASSFMSCGSEENRGSFDWPIGNATMSPSGTWRSTFSTSAGRISFHSSTPGRPSFASVPEDGPLVNELISPRNVRDYHNGLDRSLQTLDRSNESDGSPLPQDVHPTFGTDQRESFDDLSPGQPPAGGTAQNRGQAGQPWPPAPPPPRCTRQTPFDRHSFDRQGTNRRPQRRSLAIRNTTDEGQTSSFERPTFESVHSGSHFDSPQSASHQAYGEFYSVSQEDPRLDRPAGLDESVAPHESLRRPCFNELQELSNDQSPPEGPASKEACSAAEQATPASKEPAAVSKEPEAVLKEPAADPVQNEKSTKASEPEKEELPPQGPIASPPSDEKKSRQPVPSADPAQEAPKEKKAENEKSEKPASFQQAPTPSTSDAPPSAQGRVSWSGVMPQSPNVDSRVDAIAGKKRGSRSAGAGRGWRMFGSRKSESDQDDGVQSAQGAASGSRDPLTPGPPAGPPSFASGRSSFSRTSFAGRFKAPAHWLSGGFGAAARKFGLRASSLGAAHSAAAHSAAAHS